MLSHKHESNQAEKLQQLFTEITDQEKIMKQEENDIYVEETVTYKEIDVLNLPPRSEVHKKSKWHFKVRFSAPIVRFSFFVLIVILIIAIVLSFYFDEIPFISNVTL